MKNVLYLLAVLVFCIGVEARSQEIARAVGVIKPQARPDILVFSPDGKLLASALADNATISLWDTQTYTLKTRLMGEKDRLWVRGVTIDRTGIVGPSRPTFSPDGHTLVVLDYTAKEIRL